MLIVLKELVTRVVRRIIVSELDFIRYVWPGKKKSALVEAGGLDLPLSEIV